MTVRARARTAVLILAGTLAIALGACGGDDDSSSPVAQPPGQAQSQRQIRALVSQFYSADNAAKCGTLSQAAIKQVGGESACLDNDAAATKTPYEIKGIEIAGTKATVRLVAVDTRVDAKLVFEDGHWRWNSPVPLSVQF